MVHGSLGCAVEVIKEVSGTGANNQEPKGIWLSKSERPHVVEQLYERIEVTADIEDAQRFGMDTDLGPTPLFHQLL